MMSIYGRMIDMAVRTFIHFTDVSQERPVMSANGGEISFVVRGHDVQDIQKFVTIDDSGVRFHAVPYRNGDGVRVFFSDIKACRMAIIETCLRSFQRELDEGFPLFNGASIYLNGRPLQSFLHEVNEWNVRNGIRRAMIAVDSPESHGSNIAMTISYQEKTGNEAFSGTVHIEYGDIHDRTIHEIDVYMDNESAIGLVDEMIRYSFTKHVHLTINDQNIMLERNLPIMSGLHHIHVSSNGINGVFQAMRVNEDRTIICLNGKPEMIVPGDGYMINFETESYRSHSCEYALRMSFGSVDKAIEMFRKRVLRIHIPIRDTLLNELEGFMMVTFIKDRGYPMGEDWIRAMSLSRVMRGNYPSSFFNAQFPLTMKRSLDAILRNQDNRQKVVLGILSHPKDKRFHTMKINGTIFMFLNPMSVTLEQIPETMVFMAQGHGLTTGRNADIIRTINDDINRLHAYDIRMDSSDVQLISVIEHDNILIMDRDMAMDFPVLTDAPEPDVNKMIAMSDDAYIMENDKLGD